MRESNLRCCLKIVFNYEGDSIECSKAIDAKDAVISNPTLIWVRECYSVPNQAQSMLTAGLHI